MLTLVVVPPALGLPSLDGECLAAVTYMTNTLPENEWNLVADRQGILGGRTGTWHGLPALWDGDLLISGYDHIVDHLTKTSGGNWDLDRHLSRQEKAQQYGASSAVATRLRPLISLLLYTSPENYVKVTRPALASMLSFPTSWILPIHHQDDQIAISSGLGISPSQLSAAALSLTQKQKSKKEAESNSARAEPLDDTEIVRPKPVTEYIPFFGSTSAALSVHRELRKLVKDTLALYGSLVKTEPQLLHHDGVPTSLGCRVYSHLALAIAASVRHSPHPFVTSVLHHEYPQLEKLVEDWMDEEWDFELRGSKAQHAKKRRAAANKSRIGSLPWTIPAAGIGQQTKSLAANWIRTTGLAKSWSKLGIFDVREPLRYDEAGNILYTSDQGTAQGRGMGHQTDLMVGMTVAISGAVLGYFAWQEGF